MATLSSSFRANPFFLGFLPPQPTIRISNRVSSSSSHHHNSSATAENLGKPVKRSYSNGTFVEHSKVYKLRESYVSPVDPNNGNPVVKFVESTESSIEKVIFDFRFLALMAVGGSLAGSLLCFLNGCVYIFDAYRVYCTSCIQGIHSGQVVLRLVEAIDVYLAGTVMLIFGMGLYGLFVSNIPTNLPPNIDRALRGSSLLGMFSLKERPKWMRISSLDELKTKVGHVIVMILLVKMFERSKFVTITTGVDLLCYSFCIFLSSASLYILHNLHKSDGSA